MLNENVWLAGIVLSWVLIVILFVRDFFVGRNFTAVRRHLRDLTDRTIELMSCSGDDKQQCLRAIGKAEADAHLRIDGVIKQIQEIEKRFTWDDASLNAAIKILVERECNAAVQKVHERVAGAERRLNDAFSGISRLEQVWDCPSPALEAVQKDVMSLNVALPSLVEKLNLFRTSAEQEKENVGILLSELRKSLDFTINDYTSSDRFIASSVDALKQTLGNKLTMVGERQNVLEAQIKRVLDVMLCLRDALGSPPVLRRPAGWGKSGDRSKNEGNVASPQTYPDNWDVPGLD